MGNPAPLGFLALGWSFLMLMYVEMGWVEGSTLGLMVGYGFFYGGVAQMLAGIFSLFKGSTFGFVVFMSYGSFWLAWCLDFYEVQNKNSDMRTFAPHKGAAAFYAQYAVYTVVLLLVSLRKNIALIAIFTFLSIALFLLSAATAKGDAALVKAGGYFGLFAAAAAVYAGVAELVNEEYGGDYLPGLTPIVQPKPAGITVDAPKVAQIDPTHEDSETTRRLEHHV